MKKFFLFLAALLLASFNFFSCRDFFSEPDTDDDPAPVFFVVPNVGLVALPVSNVVVVNGRISIPQFSGAVPSGIFAEVEAVATDDGSDGRTAVPSQKVTGSGTIYMTATNGDVVVGLSPAITCTTSSPGFSMSLTPGKWTVTASVDGPNVTVLGSTEINVASGGVPDITVEITPRSGTGNGSVSLSLKMEDSRIAKVVSTLYGNGGNDGKSVDVSSPTSVQLDYLNIASGTYGIQLSFLDSAGGELYSFTDNVYVYPGFVTDTWCGSEFIDGNSYKITSDMITAYLASTVYVNSDGSDEEGRKGTFFDPYQTLNSAVTRIMGLHEIVGSIGYRIIVSGSTSVSSTVNIAPSSALNLTIKASSGTSEINANNSCRILSVGSSVTLTLQDLVLTGGNSSGDGGGIYNEGNLTINGTSVMNCTAQNGGAIYTKGTLTINGSSQIQGNTASIYGGAIYLYEGTTTISSDSVIGNSSATSTATSTSYSNKAKSGGGIYVTGGTLNCNGKVSYNYAENGGGILVTSTGTLNCSGTIAYNCVYKAGGAIYVTGGTSSTINGTAKISNNTATTEAGAIFCENGSLTIGETGSTNSVEINNNKVTINNGGAFLIGKSGTLTMNSGKIYSNTAKNGGAVMIWGDGTTYHGTFIMNGGEIYSNTANGSGTDGKGGAIFIDDTTKNLAEFKMNGGTIKTNTAINGKAVYLEGGKMNVSGSAFIDADNDVYLLTGKMINIAGDLTSSPNGTAFSKTNPCATITLESYPTGYPSYEQALSGTDTVLKDNYKKFKISSNDHFLANTGKVFKEIPIDNLTTDDDVDGISCFIDAVNDIKKLKELLQDGKTFENSTITLNDNLTVNNDDWSTTEGNNKLCLAYDANFKGTFDGNGKTLTFDITSHNGGEQWLSLMHRNYGIIKNLTVSGFCGDSLVGSDNNGAYIAGICIDNHGLIINCVNKASFNSKTMQSIGGISATNTGYIVNCRNEGNLTNENRLPCDWSGLYILTGGITARNEGGVIENCINTGNIKTNDHTYASYSNYNNTSGGITARLFSGGKVINSFWKKNCITQGPTSINRLVTNYSSVVSSDSSVSNCGWFENVSGNVTQASSDECGGKENNFTGSGNAQTLLNNHIQTYPYDSDLGCRVYTYNGVKIPLKTWDSSCNLQF